MTMEDISIDRESDEKQTLVGVHQQWTVVFPRRRPLKKFDPLCYPLDYGCFKASSC